MAPLLPVAASLLPSLFDFLRRRKAMSYTSKGRKGRRESSCACALSASPPSFCPPPRSSLSLPFPSSASFLAALLPVAAVLRASLLLKGRGRGTAPSRPVRGVRPFARKPLRVISDALEELAHRRVCRVAAADLLQLRRDVDLPHASLAEAPSLCLHQRAEATLFPSLPQAGEVAALHRRKGESGEV